MICQFTKDFKLCGKQSTKSIVMDSQISNLCEEHYQSFRAIILDIRLHYGFDKFKYILD